MFEIKLYGKPRITTEDKTLSISLKKSEAVLYYIAYQGRATRDEIIDLIWEETDVTVAKKNLRNCLYRLKKDLDEDVFISPGKNILVINHALVSVDGQMDQVLEAQFLNRYKGTFLEGFSMPDCPGFEAWTRDVNQSLQQAYLLKGARALEEKLARGAFEEALVIAQTLVKIDPYNEHLVRRTMTLYAELKQYHQVIQIYEQLKANLSEDLGVSPEKETMNHYFTILNGREDLQDPKAFFERTEELDYILKHSDNIFVTGEAGVGKTALMDTATASLSNTYRLLKISCYQMEMSFSLKFWDGLLEGLFKNYGSDLKLPQSVFQVLARTFPSFLERVETLQMEHAGAMNFGYIEKIVCDLLNKVSQSKPLCIYIDDVQWMDDLSLKLLASAMIKCPSVRWLGTMRNEITNAFDHFKRTVFAYKKLQMMALNRFDMDTAFRFIDYLSDDVVETGIKEKVYQESEGNAFFIVELMRLSPEERKEESLEALIGARFLGLTPQAEKVMNLMVPFFDYVEYDMLRTLYSGDEEDLLHALTEIKNKYIVQEILRDQHLNYQFTHHKLRAYLYDRMDVVKRNILHRRVAESWLDRLEKLSDKGDVRIYQKLIYHYQSAGDIVGHLTYYIKYLEIYFDFSHELYPEMSPQTLEPLDDQPELSFSILNQLILKAEGQNLEITPLKQKYHLMYGRYLIRQGYYDVGLREIDNFIQSSKDSGDFSLIFKGYVQKIYYAIQISDDKMMAQVLEMMEGLPHQGKPNAMILRFKGILAMMKDQNTLARTYFEESIRAFENLGDPKKYRLNVAAAYNYISETYRAEGAFQEALETVNKAIEICEEGKILRGLSIFNTHAGMIAYLMEDFEKSKHYLMNASSHYDQIDTLWRRGELEAYLGLLALKDHQVDLAKAHLAKAKDYATNLKTPSTMKCIQNLELEIKGY